MAEATADRIGEERIRSAWERLIRSWASTYDLSMRLLSDIGLQADGARSISDAFRDEVEAILDRILPMYLTKTDASRSLPAT